MKKRGIGIFMAAIISASTVFSARPLQADALSAGKGAKINPDTTLWFNESARDNMEVVKPPSDSWAQGAKWDYKQVRALPVGNGRLGAMIYGGTDTELIQLNEDTVWSGGPHNYARTLTTPITKANIDSSLREYMDEGETISTTAEVYEKASALVLQGETEAATKMLDRYFLGNQAYQTAYQPFVDLKLTFGHDEDKTENYSRTLDVENAVATVDYDYEGVHYSRETIASYPDQVIATHIAAGGGEKALTFSAALSNIENNYTITKISDNELQLKGRVGTHGGSLINSLPSVIHFDARLVIDTDGDVAFNNKKLDVTGASYATVYVTGATNYIDYKTVAGYATNADGDADMNSYNENEAYALASARCDAFIKHLGNKSYAEIKAAHEEDYKALYNRSAIDFSGESKNDYICRMTTDLRVANFDGYNDLSLMKLYYNYGKYLLISSSRPLDPIQSEYENMLPKAQPANLQGIWNWQTSPGWGSKYTANINVEMNYFMAQTANLAETELPLFDAVDELAESGNRTAKIHYGVDKNDSESWVLHHNFDIWRGTAPVDMAGSGMWPTGGAWLANHFWDYYQFNRDETFLRDRAYPVMRGSAMFFETYLKEYTDDDGKIYLVSPASISPEHGDVQLSPTMDNALIRNILNRAAQAADILNTDAEDAAKWREMASKIPGYDTAASGDYLREWLIDGVDERIGDAEHRHPSQLWGLHPGLDVSPYDNTEEEQRIFDAFVKALERRGEGGTGWSVAWRVCMWARAGRGDKAFSQLSSLLKKATAPNLFDMHPTDVFQIDGNFGGAAGIIEMLMQSTEKDITLLPALPAEMKYGSFDGLVARGAHEVSLDWNEGSAGTARIKAGSDGDMTVRYVNGTENVKITDDDGNDVALTVSDNKQKVTFAVSKGKTYTLTGFTETEYVPAPEPTPEARLVECINNGNMEGINGAENSLWWWGTLKDGDDDTVSIPPSNDYHSGSYGMLVTNRKSAKSGVHQYFGLENGKKYTFTAWVKTARPDTAKIIVRYGYWSDDVAASGIVTAGEWTKITADYTIRTTEENPNNVTELVILTDTNQDFLLDDVSVTYEEADTLGVAPVVTRGSDGTVSYSVTNPGGAYDLYIAAYGNDGELKEVSKQDKGSFESKDIDSVKVFVWHKDEMRPKQRVIIPDIE